MTRHAAWLIDLDGTLYRPWPVKVAMGIELFLAPNLVRRVIMQFRRQHELLRTSECERPFEEQLERTARLVNCSIDEVRSVIDDWMFERPGRWLYQYRRRGLLSEIEVFRAAGGLTALVSDYPATKKLLSLRATHLFDVIIANGESDRPCRLKPAPDGYELAASTLNVEPAKCLVIGDRPDADGVAASHASMSFRCI